MKKLKQIDFNEALERARKGEEVYAVDLNSNKSPVTKLFRRLTISEVIKDDLIFEIVEEV